MLYFALSVFVFFSPFIYLVWLYYLAVMSLKRANDKGELKGAQLWFARMIVWPGLALDALLNIVVMSIMFFEFPHEWLVTDRLSRHKRDGFGWRYAIACWLCEILLDPFDPSGCHCR